MCGGRQFDINLKPTLNIYQYTFWTNQSNLSGQTKKKILYDNLIH